MGTRAIMIQGTASDSGKPVVVAGLCRAARRRGMRVSPFKPQNMSNNAAACADGGEIGRAQAVQVRAAATMTPEFGLAREGTRREHGTTAAAPEDDVHVLHGRLGGDPAHAAL